jgi:hypothetical protein
MPEKRLRTAKQIQNNVGNAVGLTEPQKGIIKSITTMLVANTEYSNSLAKDLALLLPPDLQKIVFKAAKRGKPQGYAAKYTGGAVHYVRSIPAQSVTAMDAKLESEREIYKIKK